MTAGWAWAGFLIAWSVLFTGTVDNVVKPLFLRGSSDIHPLLIFLAVFGGMAWMQLPGILVGPVLVAFFLSLYTIYCEDYLGIPPENGLLADLSVQPAVVEAGRRGRYTHRERRVRRGVNAFSTR